MWFSTSSGSIELKITMNEALTGSHQGQCDADVLALSKTPRIAKQLAKIDPEVLRKELKKYGAWDEKELADHEQNLQRILWLACGDIVDEGIKFEG